ncbi:Uncharacterised protein at_DN1831 [Pycnogonum litorale]
MLVLRSPTQLNETQCEQFTSDLEDETNTGIFQDEVEEIIISEEPQETGDDDEQQYIMDDGSDSEQKHTLQNDELENVYLASVDAEIHHQATIDHHMEEFKTFLCTKNLALLRETSSNGNCFFEALKQELQRLKLSSFIPHPHTKELRNNVCNFMTGLSNREKG